MHTIWKYAIPLQDTFALDMPREATPLHVDVQGNEPQLWALVDAAQPTESRRFQIVGTGRPVPDNSSYVGTFQFGAGVWHLWSLWGTEGSRK